MTQEGTYRRLRECECARALTHSRTLDRHQPPLPKRRALQYGVTTDIAACERLHGSGFDVEINKPVLHCITLEVMCVHVYGRSAQKV